MPLGVIKRLGCEESLVSVVLREYQPNTVTTGPSSIPTSVNAPSRLAFADDTSMHFHEAYVFPPAAAPSVDGYWSEDVSSAALVT